VNTDKSVEAISAEPGRSVAMGCDQTDLREAHAKVSTETHPVCSVTRGGDIACHGSEKVGIIRLEPNTIDYRIGCDAAACDHRRAIDALHRAVGCLATDGFRLGLVGRE